MKNINFAHYVSLLFLVVTTFLLGACGGDDNADTLPADAQVFVTATPAPEPTALATAVSNRSSLLNTNYARIDGAIAIAHPNGWVVDSDGSVSEGTLTLGTNRSAQRGTIDNEGDFRLVIEWAPATTYGAPEETDVFDTVTLLDAQLQARNITADTAAEALPQTTTLNGAIANGATTPDDAEDDTVVIQQRYVLVNAGGGVAFYAQAQFRGDFDTLLLELLESTRYAGPTYVLDTDDLLREASFTLPHASMVRVSGVHYIENGEQVVTWSDDGLVRIFNAPTGELLSTIANDARISQALFSADASRLFVAPESQPIRVWELSTSTEIQQYAPPAGRVESFVLSPAENLLGGVVINNQNYSAVVWNVDDGTLVDTYRLASGTNITGLAFNNDETQLLVYGDNPQARVFNLESGLRTLVLSHDQDILGGFWRIDDDWIITYGRDNAARIWGGSGGNLIATLQHETSPPRGAAFNTLRTALLTWQAGSTANVWDTNRGVLLFNFETLPSLRGAAWIGNDSAIVAWTNATSTNSQIHFVDATSGETIVRIPEVSILGESALSEDLGLVVGFNADEARVHALPNGELQYFIEHPSLRGAIMSPDGQQIITYGDTGLVQVVNSTDE